MGIDGLYIEVIYIRRTTYIIYVIYTYMCIYVRRTTYVVRIYTCMCVYIYIVLHCMYYLHYNVTILHINDIINNLN